MDKQYFLDRFGDFNDVWLLENKFVNFVQEILNHSDCSNDSKIEWFHAMNAAYFEKISGVIEAMKSQAGGAE